MSKKDKYTLIGVDANAFAIMGYVQRCMRRENKTKEEIEAYTEDTESSDYANLIRVSVNMIEELNK